MNKYFIITISIFLICINSYCQQKIGALQSKDGVYIFLNDEAIGANFKYAKYDNVKINLLNNGKQNIIGTATGAKNLNELKSYINQEGIDDLKKQKKLANENEVYNYVTNNGNTSQYALSIFNPKFMEALGVLYMHKINTKEYIGKKLNYELVYYKNNSVVNTQNISVDIVEKLNAPKPIFKTKRETDSMVNVTWYTGKENMLGIIGANLYRSNNKEKFELLERVFAIMPNKKQDSILFSYTDFTTKGDYNRYYIKPINYAGFEGSSSDTIAAFSVNFNAINQAVNLKAKDTAYGIYLSFDPPPASPLITSIIIQKSRYDKTGYVDIDTISPTSTFYLDEKVLSNVTYYYQLKTLSIKQNDLLPTAWASAIHNNKTNSEALAPVNIKATATVKGVVISWLAQANDQTAGFRIYRANNSMQPMQLISLLQKENSFIDTTALDNRRKYAYAVSSLNYSDKESKLSDKVYVAPINHTIIPLSPNGLMGSAEQGRVMLSWTAIAVENNYVMGYKIYRKEMVADEKIKDKIWKANELLQNGFKLINEKPIKAATFIDEFDNSKDKYTYYVTAIDNKGLESNATNGLMVEMPKTTLNPPGNFSARKISTGIALSWDKSKQQNITGYIIYKRESTNPKSTMLIKLDKNAETYIDKATQKNKTYFYTVAVVNNTINGSASLEKGVFIN